MKNARKLAIFFLIAVSASTPAFAGKWVNWGAIVEDVKDGIVTVVDWISGNRPCNKTEVVASGAVITKEVSLGKVDTIDVTGTGSLIVAQDGTQEGVLVIQADQALMPYIETQILDNKLVIKLCDNISYNVEKEGLVYSVRIKNLTNITLSGAVRAQLNSIKTKSLLLSATGASQVSGDIAVESLLVESAGASRIMLSGEAKVQNFGVSGSCKVDGRNLTGKSAVINITGASNVYCNVSDVLTGYVSGVSSLYYANNPTFSVKTSGISSVQRL